MNNTERYNMAKKIALQYRGAVDGKLIDPEPFSIMQQIFPDHPDMTDEYLLADVMSRPVLNLRERSIIIITTQLEIRFTIGVKHHMNRAINVGLSREEVAEIVMVASMHGGWPAGEEILTLIREAFPGFLDDPAKNPLEKIWHQPGLTSREHSMITIAAFATLRFGERLKAFIGQILDSNLNRDEILEVIIQITPFSGWAVGVEALRIAGEIFASKD